MIGWAPRALIVIGLVLSTYFIGMAEGNKRASVKCAGEQSAQLIRFQGERDAIQQKLNESAQKWAEDQKRSESLAASTVDSLTESGIRLRVKLADATIEATQGYNRGVTDGRAELHRETAEGLVRVAQDADRHVKALQDALKEVTQ